MAKEKEQDVAELKQENAALHSRLANLEKMFEMQKPVVYPQQIEMQRQEEFQRRQVELSKSCHERTQDEARRRWTGCTTEFSVKLADTGKGPRADQLQIMIPARSPEEARARYEDLCGILSVDMSSHKYEIGAPVPVSPA